MYFYLLANRVKLNGRDLKVPGGFSRGAAKTFHILGVIFDDLGGTPPKTPKTPKMPQKGEKGDF